MLIPFPIAFLTGAFASDVYAKLSGQVSWAAMAGTLCAAGIIGALIAAIPGFVDFFSVIPSGTPAKNRGTAHMIANLSVVAIFVAAWFLRPHSSDEFPSWAIVGLEGLGFILLGVSGWLGGTLAYRNQIGVDPLRE